MVALFGALKRTPYTNRFYLKRYYLLNFIMQYAVNNSLTQCLPHQVPGFFSARHAQG